uniref:Uncharacterized protein n=1 Tax=Cannabis sativa TaxID=3483 RepID=A0A803QRG1_CANSA
RRIAGLHQNTSIGSNRYNRYMYLIEWAHPLETTRFIIWGDNNYFVERGVRHFFHRIPAAYSRLGSSGNPDRIFNMKE